ncbi:MAG: FAD:protein FMN transferase [Candidatus Eisenbacteria bacterium]|nr:FAD:protein FMN transferase [Candidatus Eisenbacteria bacterium]
MRRGVAALVALPFWLLLAVAPAPAARKPHRNPAAVARQPAVERARYLMGTICTVRAEALDTVRAGLAVEEAFGEIARLEQVMSSWRDDSELARLNAEAGEDRVPCSPDLYAVLDSALALAGETDGAFDPTIEPLARLWDLRGQGRVPDMAQIAAAKSRVGWRMVLLDPGRRTARFTRPGVGVDLGGIGKGYALDRAADALRGRGVKRALLNLGGEVLAMTRGAPWAVSVAHPGDRLVPVVRLALSNGAVSTSSQGERFVTVKGARFGHILDPRSGSPARTEASVTVVAGSGTRADALSTALLVLGLEDARAFARAHPDIGVLWIEPDGPAVRAWAWNLPALAEEPGARVDWMQR